METRAAVACEAVNPLAIETDAAPGRTARSHARRRLRPDRAAGGLPARGAHPGAVHPAQSVIQISPIEREIQREPTAYHRRPSTSS